MAMESNPYLGKLVVRIDAKKINPIIGMVIDHQKGYHRDYCYVEWYGKQVEKRYYPEAEIEEYHNRYLLLRRNLNP
jgi:hypothetical protein